MKSTLFLLFIILILAFGSGCNSEDESNPVVPASKFTGNWKSEVPIEVIVQTDYCTNVLEDVATMDWNVQWAVTETDNPNIIDIRMTYTTSNFTVTNSACTDGAGYVPEPSPIFLKGYITGDSLTIKYGEDEIFTFDYANNEMIGELSYSYCILFCQKIYTNENDFKIVKY